MKFLVFGGAGFLGINLVRSLVSKFPGSTITIVDSLEAQEEKTLANLEDLNQHFEFIVGDIRSQNLLNRLVPEADIIFNFAAQTSHIRSMAEPILDAEINCLGSLLLLETVRKKRADAVVVYPSTTSVVGRALFDVVDENHPERPTDLYSAHKGVAEKYYEIYANVHGIKTVVLRFPNLYGPFGRPTSDFGFFNYFISLAWNEKAIKVYGSGEQIRNVMYIEDAIDLMIQSIERPEVFGKIYFATSPFHHSLREIADNIVSSFSRGRVESIPWPEERLKIEVGGVRFSSDELRRVTGWQAKTSLKTGLDKTKIALMRLNKKK